MGKIRIVAIASLALLTAIPALCQEYNVGISRRRTAGGGGPYTFTYVGGASGSEDNTSPQSVSTGTGINVESGDLVIAWVQWEDSSTAEITTGAFDDQDGNNDLTKDSEIHNSGSQMNGHLWWGIANATRTGAVWTADIDTAVGFKKIVVTVYRKSGGTISKDISGTPAVANDTDSSSVITTGSFSTTGANNVVCGMGGFYTSGTWSSHTINAVADDRVLEPSGVSMWCRDNVSALSSVTASATYSAARYWVASAISFKAE